LIGLLYAAHLQEAALLLRCLIFGAVLMTMDQILSSTMTAARAQHQDLLAMGLGVVVLLVVLAVLIPGYGPLGAAVAVPLGLLLRVLWRLRWASHTLGLAGLRLALLRTALAGCLGVLALVSCAGLGVWASAALALLAYLLSAQLLGVIPAQAWQQARAHLSRLVLRQASH